MPYSYQSVIYIYIYIFECIYTVGCSYGAVNFLSMSHKIPPISCSLGWALLWGVTCKVTLILILRQTMRCSMTYQVILDRVVAARAFMYVSTCICVQVRQCTVYPHYPVIHICIFLTQTLSVRLGKTPLICIDSAYDVACYTYSTRPPQGRGNADCLMNYHK